MTIIKKIIEWIIKLFKKIFGCKKISSDIKSSINKQNNKRYFKEYGNIDGVRSTGFPIYLMIDERQKEELINKIKLIKEKVNKEDRDIINNLIKEIQDNNISFYQNELINEKLDKVLEDTKLEIDTAKKIISLDEEVIEIIENYDRNIKEKTKKEYDVVNYVTLTTMLLDETEKELVKLEEDFRHHKYNKYYYERELKRIKIRINDLRKLRDNESVKEEIEALKHELYTKKKDKYDLLYGDEVFSSFDKTCDDLLKKVNRRIIDLKKEKEEKKIKEAEKRKIEKQKDFEKKKKEKEDKDKLKKEKELLENILKRYKDLELARKILLMTQNKEMMIKNERELFNYFDNAYLDFVSGEKFKFNFERNKTKLELVKFLNNISYLNSSFKKRDFVPFEHINYSMIDLVNLVNLEKGELESILEERFNYQKEKNEVNILVDNKLDILREKEIKKEERKHVLVKTNNEK